MFFIRILNFLKGYLIITVEGKFTERFINICIRRNILIWDVRRSGINKVRCKIATDDFYKLRDVARITSSKPRITNRMGLPFRLIQYRNRWPIFISIILFISIIYFTSTHIMSVDVTGNERIPTDQIMSELSDIGVSLGYPVSSLTPDRIRNEMIIRNNDIAWLGVNIRGCRVYIEVTERIDTESIPHIDGDPCNLVATIDGVIDEMEVKQGQSMVVIGDAVREGDLLVSGIMDSVYGTFRSVHSYGEIYAKTIYSETQEYPLKYIQRLYSSDTHTFISLDFFGNDVEMFIRKNLGTDMYEETVSDYIYKTNFMGKDIEVGAKKHEFVLYKDEETSRSVSEAVKLGTKEMTEKVEERIPKAAKIVSKKSDHNIVSGETVEVTVTYECSENIAKQSEIDKSLIDKSDNLDYDIENDKNSQTSN